MNRKKTEMLKDTRGFTLVEIMIAVFVLAVALGGVISVTVMVMKGNDQSRYMTTATALAQAKIDEVKRTTYNSVVGGTDYRNLDSSVGTAGAFFTRVWTVTEDTSHTAKIKTVVVTVSWTSGIAHNVTLRTVIGE